MHYNPYSVAFDIETEGLGESVVLARTKPFEEFDPAGVKLGDCYSDEARAAKLARAAEEHEREREAYQARAVERAALVAETGRVLTISYLPVESDNPIVDYSEDESVLLTRFWKGFRKVRGTTDGKLVGHNILGFDLPFLVRRSWINRVPVPGDLFTGRYFSAVFIDTMQVWACGEYRRFITLDLLGSLLGVGGKSEQEVTGAQFAAYWRAGGEKRELAKAYAARDVVLVRDVYRALCTES